MQRQAGKVAAKSARPDILIMCTHHGDVLTERYAHHCMQNCSMQAHQKFTDIHTSIQGLQPYNALDICFRKVVHVAVCNVACCIHISIKHEHTCSTQDTNVFSLSSSKQLYLLQTHAHNDGGDGHGNGV